jgi:hypothetical protein
MNVPMSSSLSRSVDSRRVGKSKTSQDHMHRQVDPTMVPAELGRIRRQILKQEAKRTVEPEHITFSFSNTLSLAQCGSVGGSIWAGSCVGDVAARRCEQRSATILHPRHRRPAVSFVILAKDCCPYLHLSSPSFPRAIVPDRLAYFGYSSSNSGHSVVVRLE